MSFNYVQLLTNGNLQSLLQSAVTSQTAANLLEKLKSSGTFRAVGDSFASKIEVIRAYKNDLSINMAKTTALINFIDAINDLCYESSEFEEQVSVDEEHTLDLTKMRSRMTEEGINRFFETYQSLCSISEVFTITLVDGRVVCLKFEALSDQDIEAFKSGETLELPICWFVVRGGTDEEELIPCLVLTYHDDLEDGKFMLSVSSHVYDIEGRELNYSLFDLESQLATSDAFNTCVDTASELVLRGKFEFNEYKALLSARISTEKTEFKEKINTLSAAIGEACLKGGLYGVVSYLLKLISSPASIEVSGGVLVFTTNASYVPKEYIVGTICTIVGTVTSVVGAILTAVSPYIGIAVSLIGSVLTQIPQAINYDYDQNTVPAYNEDYAGGCLCCCPFSIYRLTLTPTTADQWVWRMSQTLRETGCIYYNYVPGALVLIGLMTSKPGEIRVNIDVHPTYDDCIDLFNEKVLGRKTWRTIEPIEGFTWNTIQIIHSRISFNSYDSSGKIQAPFWGVIDTATADRALAGYQPASFGIMPHGLLSVTAFNVEAYWQAARKPNKLFSPYDGHLLSPWADVYTRLCVLGNIGLFYMWICSAVRQDSYTNMPIWQMIGAWGQETAFEPTTDDTMWFSISCFASAVSDLLYWNELLSQAGVSFDADVNYLLERLGTQDFINTGSQLNNRYRTNVNRLSWSNIIGMYYDVLITRPTVACTEYHWGWGNSASNAPILAGSPITYSYDVMGHILDESTSGSSMFFESGIPIENESPSWGILMPKYNRGTFLRNVAAAVITTIAITAVTILTVVGVKRAITMKRLANAAAVEHAWTKACENPDDPAYQKDYYRTVKKANRWQKLIGGTRFDRTNYWSSGVPEDASESSSGDQEQSSLMDYFKSEAIVDDNDSTCSLTDLYKKITGKVPDIKNTPENSGD